MPFQTFRLQPPPWLHGHCPLRRYYGDSDSCPAPSSTRTGLLDYRTCLSRHSVSNPPLGSTVIARFVATTGTLTPALLLPAPGQVSLITEHAFPDIPSPTPPLRPRSPAMLLVPGGL